MEKYNKVYTTDWNKGEHSGMLPLERLKIHNLWLEKNHNDCKPTSTETENPAVGFDYKPDTELQGFIKF